MPRGKKAVTAPRAPNARGGAVPPDTAGARGTATEGRVAAMDVTLTATSSMGDDKVPLALRVEQAMNDAGNQARESGAEPDEILRAKVAARNRVMSEVTGEPLAPEYQEGARKASKKAAKAPRKAATSRKAKK